MVLWIPRSVAGPPSLVPNGPPTDVVFSAGQTSETYVYQATAGQYLTLYIGDGTWPSETDPELKLYDPNDNFVVYTYFGQTGWTGEIGPLLSGTYTFDLTAPDLSTTESAEFYFATDQTGTLPTDGGTFDFATQEPGQYARYQFAAVSGQTFTLTSTGDFAAECDVTMYLLDPSGANEQYSCTGLSGYFDYTVPTTGTWTLYIVNPDIESGTISMNATLSAPPGGAYAYVWANQPATSSYTPTRTFSKNSTGGTNTIVRYAVGDYVVSFPGLAGVPGGTVDVTGDDTAGYCKVAYWSPSGTAMFARILCFGPGGAPADTEFDAVFASASTGPSHLTYLWANQPTTASYTPSTTYQYNSRGGTDTIVRDSTGDYEISIPDIGKSAGTIKVTGYGSDTTNCRIGDWGGSPTLEVNVLCAGANGSPADAEYALTWVNKASLLAKSGGKWGYVWANEPTEASYTPDAAYQGNSTHAVNTITRSGVGAYVVDFPGLGGTKGDVQVSAYSTDAVCNTAGWSSDGSGGADVNVECFDAAGSPVDSYFTAQYLV